jgi:carboxyl-terminal processing protease
MKTKILFLSLLIAVSCDDTDTPTTGINYLNEVLDVMQKNSVYRKSIDWPAFRSQALAKADGAKSITDVYPAIEFALLSLGDHHSHYEGASKNYTAFDKACSGASSGSIAPDSIGYVKVNTFMGIGDEANKYATDMQNLIKTWDNENLAGWVVDLRGNVGANIWAMLGGVGPILGNGTAGYFIDPDGNTESWEYKNGNAIDGGSTYCTVGQPYSIINPNAKVAVLINQATIGAGEAVAIAFIGRPNTKLFGVSTCGVSTAIDTYTLSDGATLELANGVMADRNKNEYGGPISPDIIVVDNSQIMTQAVAWIKQQ